MTIHELSKILNLHHISHKLIESQLYAEEIGTINDHPYHQWINVTDWDWKKILDWLGY